MANTNPQTMTDEELDAALEELGVPVPEATGEEEPKEPETPPADPAEEPDPKEEETSEEEEPEPKPEDKKKPEEGEPSHREVKRIQDLLRKYPQQEPKAPVETKQPQGLLDIDKDVDADEALKERLKADRDAAAQAALEQGRREGGLSLAEEKASLLFHTRLEIDAPRVEGKYPVLDKDSDKFKPALAKDVNTLYLQACGYDFDADTASNPNIRYSDFVEAFFHAANDAASELAEDSKQETVKRIAKTGLRPEGTASKPKLNLNKLPGQMTDEELDAAIAQGVPSR